MLFISNSNYSQEAILNCKNYVEKTYLIYMIMHLASNHFPIDYRQELDVLVTLMEVSIIITHITITPGKLEAALYVILSTTLVFVWIPYTHIFNTPCALCVTGVSFTVSLKNLSHVMHLRHKEWHSILAFLEKVIMLAINLCIDLLLDYLYTWTWHLSVDICRSDPQLRCVYLVRIW